MREARALARGMGRTNWARAEVGQVDCGEKDWAGVGSRPRGEGEKGSWAKRVGLLGCLDWICLGFGILLCLFYFKPTQT